MLKSNTVSVAAPITTNGAYCTCRVSMAPPSTPAASLNLGVTYWLDGNQEVFDSGSYLIQTGTLVSAGAVGLNILTLSPSGVPVWVAATTPNSATGAAFTLIATLAATTVYNGSLNVAGSAFFPCLGLQLVVSGLTGGNITLAQLCLTRR